jgi:hypothetical protein
MKEGYRACCPWGPRSLCSLFVDRFDRFLGLSGLFGLFGLFSFSGLFGL